MQFSIAAATTALFTLALQGVQAQNADASICDKYTSALLKNNTAANQKTILAAIVNTALIGNFSAYSTVEQNNFAPILAADSPLLKYFDGSTATANRGGQPTNVTFLDGGGAAPLMEYKPAADNATNSNQYRLVSHLYQYFGALLGCSAQSNATDATFRTYQGDGSMSKVHRFMNLTTEENNYFISAVGASAASFGVSSSDITAVASTLNATFGFQCAIPASVAGSAVVSQSICLAPSCPTADPSNCTAGPNSFPNAAAAAVSDTADNTDDDSNNNENAGEASTGAGASGNGGSGSGSGSGSGGSSGNTDAATTNMASIAIGSTLGLGALVVATLF